MQVPIPGTDLELVVRRIREISRKMDEREDNTQALRRYRPVSRWRLSGEEQHVRRQLDVGGSPCCHPPPRSPSLPPARPPPPRKTPPARLPPPRRTPPRQCWHSGGENNTVTRCHPSDYCDREDPATQTPAAQDRLGSRRVITGCTPGSAEPADSPPGVALLRGVWVEGGPAAAAANVTRKQRPLPGPRARDPALGEFDDCVLCCLLRWKVVSDKHEKILLSKQGVWKQNGPFQDQTQLIRKETFYYKQETHTRSHLPHELFSPSSLFLITYLHLRFFYALKIFFLILIFFLKHMKDFFKWHIFHIKRTERIIFLSNSVFFIPQIHMLMKSNSKFANELFEMSPIASG